MLEGIRSKIVIVPEKKKGGKKKKGELSSFEMTLKLLESGMTVEEIAKERELVVGTIIGHLADGIIDGRLSIFKFMSKEDVEVIENAINEMPGGFTSKDLYTVLEGKFGYGYLRAVMNHVRRKEAAGPHQEENIESEANS
jgi:ATP-dependent DNA helicase RecQ